MSLTDAIAAALANSDPPPPDESTTCEWIIYPLLLAAGYARRDIASRIADNNGQFPDYTILPGSPHTWFLEAKAWSQDLQDNHAQQSLNYANQNGKRWVVLSNGREWRLYDNTIQGIAADKLVSSALLAINAQIEPFLHAISRPAIVGGRLDDYARRVRTTTLLAAQLGDENSDVIRAVWAAIRKFPGLGSVTRACVVEYFRLLIKADGVAPPPPTGTAQATTRTSDTEQAPRPGTARAAESGEILNSGHACTPAAQRVSLADLAVGSGAVLEYSRTERVVFPDGVEATTPRLREVASAIVEWIMRQGGMPPLPFRGSQRGNRYFANSEARHANGPMRGHRHLELADQSLYIDVHRSATDLVLCLHGLCVAAGVSPADIILYIRPVAYPTGRYSERARVARRIPDTS